MQKHYPNDSRIGNLAKLSQATLLKYGSLPKRVNASELFDELLDYFPFFIAREYLDLLFDDLTISQDQETLEKVDFLMNNYIDKPLSYNHIINYVSQQILLARYNFFIKNKINMALEILIEAQERISKLKIENLNSKIDNELKRFKKERIKWENLDISIKERIEKSEFQKYIQQGLEMKMV